MFKSMLFLHWKQARPGLALAIVASFALPIIAVEGLGRPVGRNAASVDAYRFIAAFDSWLPLFPLLALGVGVVLALSAWNWDHQLKHVYALSLPMTRWEYTLKKLLAGVTLCAAPAAAMWVGAHLAAASIDLPTGLKAYPNELSIRFLFATLISYSVWFALAAGTIRTTAWVVGSCLGFMFFGLIANDVLSTYFVYFEQVVVVEEIINWLMHAPGPFEVFTGNWSLIDV